MVVVAVVAILAGAGVGFLVGSAGERTVVVTSFSTTTVTSTYINDAGALLRLQVTLNASTVRSGGAIDATVSVVNPLDRNLTAVLPSPQDATFRGWDSSDFVCGRNPLAYAASFALFRGRIDPGNLSMAGTPLTLAAPVFLPCALLAPPSLLVFGPLGSGALAYFPYGNVAPVRVSTDAGTGACEALGTGATSCGGPGSLFGYWSASASASCGNSPGTSSSCFHYFEPGWYTLAVEGAWGQSAFASFLVT